MAKNNLNVITLNGKQYVVEDIPGKGECLVPYVKPKVLYQSLVGKVVKGRMTGVTKFVVRNGKDVQFVALRTGNITDSYPADNEVDENYFMVIADSLSEAIQKGLIK